MFNAFSTQIQPNFLQKGFHKNFLLANLSFLKGSFSFLKGKID